MLFIANPIMLQLLELLQLQCRSKRLANIPELRGAPGVALDTLEKIVQNSRTVTCAAYFEPCWVPAVVNVVMANEDGWWFHPERRAHANQLANNHGDRGRNLNRCFHRDHEPFDIMDH